MTETPQDPDLSSSLVHYSERQAGARARSLRWRPSWLKDSNLGHLREVLSNLTKDAHRLTDAQTSLPDTEVAPSSEGVRALRQPNHKLTPVEVAALVAAYETPG